MISRLIAPLVIACVACGGLVTVSIPDGASPLGLADAGDPHIVDAAIHDAGVDRRIMKIPDACSYWDCPD